MLYYLKGLSIIPGFYVICVHVLHILLNITIKMLIKKIPKDESKIGKCSHERGKHYDVQFFGSKVQIMFTCYITTIKIIWFLIKKKRINMKNKNKRTQSLNKGRRKQQTKKGETKRKKKRPSRTCTVHRHAANTCMWTQ
jgi:hypothetical protein